MKNDKDNWEEKIRAYVFGELITESDNEEVENALAGSAELRQLRDDYVLCQDILQNERAKVLQAEPAPVITADGPAGRRPGPGIVSPALALYRRLKPVLAVAAVMVLGVLPTLQTYRYADGSVARRAFHGPAGEAVAGTTGEAAAALDDFSAGRYREAHAGFQQLLTAPDQRARASYYLPLASFHLGEHERARREFAAIEGLDQYPEKDRREVDWFILLNDLALGEDVSARLDAIVWDEDEKAALQEDLDGFWRWKWLK